MSSTEKGTTFEERVYKILQAELTNGKLLVNPVHSKLFKKKGYFSRDRNSNIITDLSIEVSYEEGQVGLYIIIECKDTTKRISVDDIEEFDSKLRQIAGKNIKGIFVSTSALQKAAFNYARFNGIAVFRVFPEKYIRLSFNKIEYTKPPIITEEEDKKTKIDDYSKGLFEDEYSENLRTYYGYYLDRPYLNLTSLINSFDTK